MYKYIEFPSGSVLCTHPHGKGSVAILCDDLTLTPLQRADKARQQVDEILERLAATPTVTTAAVNTGLKVSCELTTSQKQSALGLAPANESC